MLSQAIAEQPQPPVNALAAQWVDQISGLVSLPDVCMRLTEILQSPKASARSLGEVVARDPNLTARLLRLVNSAFYGFVRRIETVSRAIAIIGDRELYNLVLAVSAVKSFKGVPSVLVNMDSFWRHSMYCGLIARELGKRCRILHPERLFVAGLLHDIGSLIMYKQVPGLAKDLLMVARGDEKVLCEAEEQALGFGHAELGSLLLARWMLPDCLVAAVRYHHHPALAGEHVMEASVVHLAEVFANRSQIGALFEESAVEPEIDPIVWGAISLSPENLDQEQIIGEAGLQFAETAHLLAANG